MAPRKCAAPEGEALGRDGSQSGPRPRLQTGILGALGSPTRSYRHKEGFCGEHSMRDTRQALSQAPPRLAFAPLQAQACHRYQGKRLRSTQDVV